LTCCILASTEKYLQIGSYHICHNSLSLGSRNSDWNAVFASMNSSGFMPFESTFKIACGGFVKGYRG
jgi:hypothetical protein